MLRNLILDRPLACIDIETTGLIEPGNMPRIVEIAVIRVGRDLSVNGLVRRVNPEMPIPAAASNVHGITDQAVDLCPNFLDALPAMLDLLHGADLTGFNIAGFDLPVIQSELTRVAVARLNLEGRLVVDSMQLFHRFYPPRPGVRGQSGLAAACRHYLGARPVMSHSALWDAIAALQILDAMIVWHCLPGHVRGLLDALIPEPIPQQPARVVAEPVHA